MKSIFVYGLCAAGFALSGCVSVFEGTSQDISVNTTPPGATCVFEREGRPIGTLVSTPGTLTVRKSKYDITVRCEKPGFEQAAMINKSGTSAAIAANVIVDVVLTLGVSSIIDSANGADNKYEPVVGLTLMPVGGVAPTATGTPTTLATTAGATVPVNGDVAASPLPPAKAVPAASETTAAKPVP